MIINPATLGTALARRTAHSQDEGMSDTKLPARWIRRDGWWASPKSPGRVRGPPFGKVPSGTWRAAGPAAVPTDRCSTWRGALAVDSLLVHRQRLSTLF